MAKFDPPIWIKPQEDEKDVIVFGKSPEQITNDSEYGYSRFGGAWRAPSYVNAYLRSTKILFNEGFRTGALDDIGLPLFYLQRHTAELLLKRLLSWILEIAEFDIKLSGQEAIRSKIFKRRNIMRTHSLPSLIKDLRELSDLYKFDSIPKSLKDLVNKLTKAEVTDTWSRYPTSGKNDSTKHVEKEHEVPIKKIQEALEVAIAECLMNGFDDEQAYEQAYYDKWLTKARETGCAA